MIYLIKNCSIDTKQCLCYYKSMDHESYQHNQSLAKFNLSFEYDKSWGEAKKAIKARATAE